MIYTAKPYVCAAIGFAGIATGSGIGIVCGLLLLVLAAYIVWMRRNYE